MTLHRRGPVAAFAVLLTAAALALTPSPVVAAECPDQLPACVVVTVVKIADGQTTESTTYTVTPADLQAWTDQGLNDRRYAVRQSAASQGGTIDDQPQAQGQRVSINTVLSRVDPRLIGTATFLETPNATGVPSVLSAADLVDPAAPDDADGDGQPDRPAYPFLEKLPPAVYLAGDGRIGYIRPLRDAAEDTNAADYFQVSGRLDLTVHTTGSLLTPTVASSEGAEIAKGAKTTFSAEFADKPRTRIFSTRWDFGDGSTKSTKVDKPSKAYAKRGTFPVVVTVRGNDGSYGRSAPLEVKVAKPPKAPSSGTGGGTGLGGGGGAFTPPPSSFDDFLPPGDIDDVPTEEQPAPVPVDDGLEPVVGYVLAGAEIVPGGTPETIPGTESSTAPAPATQASLGERLATWIVAALAVMVLVGLGAVGETRWFRTRLRHLRRSA